mgnify:FL=1
MNKEQFAAENLALANEFAEPGTLKHFMLKNGFMPHDEKEAEDVLLMIIHEWEELKS